MEKGKEGLQETRIHSSHLYEMDRKISHQRKPCARTVDSEDGILANGRAL